MAAFLSAGVTLWTSRRTEYRLTQQGTSAAKIDEFKVITDILQAMVEALQAELLAEKATTKRLEHQVYELQIEVLNLRKQVG